MPLHNVILCAYKEAHVEVEEAGSVAANGRRESYLELGTVEDRDLAVEVAQAVVDVQALRRAATVIDPLPRFGPDGFIDYGLGDTITGLNDSRVVGITVSMDDEGRASVIPELRDRVAVKEEEVNRLLRRLADGGLGGGTEQATRTYPAPPPVLPGRVMTLEAVSFDGPLVAGSISPPQNPPSPMQIVHIVTNLRVAGSSATGVRILDENGNVRCSVVIPATRRLYAVDVNPPEYVSERSQLLVDTPTVGAGAEGLTVEIQVTTT